MSSFIYFVFISFKLYNIFIGSLLISLYFLYHFSFYSNNSFIYFFLISYFFFNSYIFNKMKSSYFHIHESTEIIRAKILSIFSKDFYKKIYLFCTYRPVFVPSYKNLPFLKLNSMYNLSFR